MFSFGVAANILLFRVTSLSIAFGVNLLATGFGRIPPEELTRPLDRAPVLGIEVRRPYQRALVVEAEGQIVDLIAL